MYPRLTANFFQNNISYANTCTTITFSVGNPNSFKILNANGNPTPWNAEYVNLIGHFSFSDLPRMFLNEATERNCRSFSEIKIFLNVGINRRKRVKLSLTEKFTKIGFCSLHFNPIKSEIWIKPCGGVEFSYIQFIELKDLGDTYL